MALRSKTNVVVDTFPESSDSGRIDQCIHMLLTSSCASSLTIKSRRINFEINSVILGFN